MKHLIALSISLIVVFAVSGQNELGDGFYDDVNPLIVKTNCNENTNTSMAFDTHHACNAASSAKIEFSFYGDEFAIWARRNLSGGDIEICIDVSCSTVSSYSATITYGEWVRFTQIALGNHDVTITPQTGRLDFDAVYIAPVPVGGGAEATPEINAFVVEVSVLTETTPEPYELLYTVNDGEQPVLFSYSVTAGDYVTVTLLIIILFIVIGLSVVIALRWR